MEIDIFILKALVLGVLVAVVASLLGCFVVWKKMAYFGDSLAHSTLLGVALGTALQSNISIFVVLICFLFAFCLLWIQSKNYLATDSILGILSHFSLSLGVIIISLLDGGNFDLHGYLFGNILLINTFDLYLIFFLGFVVLLTIYLNYKKLVLMSISKDLAQAEGVDVGFMNLVFTLLLAFSVAISIQTIGILLITSLLVIPPATARLVATSPIGMMIFACVIGAIDVVLGMIFSIQLDIPLGPSIVLVGSIFFAILLVALGVFGVKHSK
jgi:zinc transport system permease protein